MSKSTGKKFAIGTMLAAAAGYIAGILTAPKSGKETRKDIKNAAQQAWSEGEKQLKRAHTELTVQLNQAREKAAKLKGDAKKQFDETVARAQAAKERARKTLSAIHEGDTEDKDLQSAIDEANKAVEHLKAYLKKSAQ
jgi:gas vesicle protein